MAETEPFSLAQFVAQETQLFYQRLHEAVQKHEESGEVPPSLFGQKAIRALKKAGGRRKGAAGDAPKRKPSVFNLYIKEKLEEMNAQPALSTVPYKEKFRQVVAQWSKLNDGEKNKYKDKYAAQLARHSACGIDACVTLIGMSDYLIIGAPLCQYLAIACVSVAITNE